MRALKWIFDPLPPSGALQGGNPSLHVFKPDLDTFVREVLQNARDQRVKDETVRVEFLFDELDGAHKEEFLHAIGWTELRPHVEGAASAGFAQISRSIMDGLRSVEEEPLVLLRITDTGTRGLAGDEDDAASNFNALCRNTLVSSDRPERGGSYGLGKAVLWRYSSILTVLFSSRVADSPRAGFRFFGRAELPYHQALGERYAGPGWYGLKQKVGSGAVRAISAWDDDVEALAVRARLNRPRELGTGTSILVVGFREPQQEQVRSTKQVATDVCQIAANWFWPSIERGQLQVRVVVAKNGEVLHEFESELTPEVMPFVLAQEAAELQDAPLRPGGVAELLLPLRVPGRKADGGSETPPVEAHVRFRVRRTDGSEGKSDLTNKVALTRGAGMVVQYRPVRVVAGDYSFHAVLLAGLASGMTEADQAVERFLRAAEPPAHDEWTVTPRVRSEYKQGFGRALRDLWDALDEKVTRLFEEQPEDNSPGPILLAKLFPLRLPSGTSGGGATGTKFRVRDLTAVFDGDRWQFEGAVLRLGRKAKPWSVRVQLRLAEETGAGEPLGIAQLEAEDGVRVEGDASSGYTLLVPADLSGVFFIGQSLPVMDVVDLDTAQRTRLDIVVRPVMEDQA